MGMNLFHLTNEAMEQALAKAMMPGDRFSCPVYVSFGRPSVFSSSLSNQYGCRRKRKTQKNDTQNAKNSKKIGE